MDSPPPSDEEQETWNYLTYKLLSELDKAQHDWRSVTSTQFSKLPCLADRYLLDRLGRDIAFPRYWYKYGEVGNRDPLDSSLYIQEPSDEFGGYEVRPAVADVSFEMDENARTDIDEAISFVVSNFANVSIDSVKEFQYQHFAPEPFIREFEELRKKVYDISSKRDDDFEEGAYTDDVKEMNRRIRALAELYPYDKYGEMQEDFEDWVDVMEVLLDERDFRRGEAILEEFWAVFSKVHLRMEHNNRPIPDQIERWEIENESQLSRFRKTLSRLKEELV